jgi:drug/metabolite transporter (DMT)-like permease
MRTTPPSPAARRTSKWGAPLLSVAFGVVFLAAEAANDHAGRGLGELAVMLAFAAVIAFGGRSETIRGLRGDGRDERFAQIDLHATAFAGITLIVAVIVAFVVQLAQDRPGAPYSWLGAIAAVAYVAAIAWQRVRG